MGRDFRLQYRKQKCKSNADNNKCYDMLEFKEIEDIITIDKDLNEPHLIYNEDNGTYEKSEHTIGEWLNLNKNKEYIPIHLNKNVIGYMLRESIIKQCKSKKE
jgi:hypothetical protein